MKKLNCWEIMDCGREPGGHKTHDLGVCPAATAKKCTGINDGKNGGRICWAIAGTFCKDQVQGCNALRIASCIVCDVYERVKREERKDAFVMLKTKKKRYSKTFR